MKSVEDAGLFWQFSNSFLVLCSTSPEPVLAEEWLIKKFSNSSALSCTIRSRWSSVMADSASNARR